MFGNPRGGGYCPTGGPFDASGQIKAWPLAAFQSRYSRLPYADFISEGFLRLVRGAEICVQVHHTPPIPNGNIPVKYCDTCGVFASRGAGGA